MSENSISAQQGKKISIAIVNTHIQDTVGGSQLQCDIIAEELYKRGHRVSYIAVGGCNNSYNTIYNVIGVKRESEAIRKAIMNSAPDVLYWRFNKKFFYKSVKKPSQKGIKIVFAVSNIRDLQPYSARLSKGSGITGLKEFILKNIVSRYNHMGYSYVDALTVNNKNHLSLSPITPKKYVPNATTQKSKSFTWKKPYVLWVANIKNRKQPELYVNLAKNFERRDIDFLMMGKIEDNSYNWLSKEDSVPENFHYLGPQPIETVNGALKNSLFLVTTSTPEGFSNNIIQAWLQGKPVIAYEFDPGGLIESNRLGKIANGDFNMFLKHSEQYIDNQKIRQEAGNRALAFANQYFSTQETIATLEELFYDVLSGS